MFKNIIRDNGSNNDKNIIGENVIYILLYSISL